MTMAVVPKIDKTQAIEIPVLSPVEQFASADTRKISDEDAAVVGAELIRMQQTYGVVTPEVIVCEARNEQHPLHRWFLWDDTEAAHRFRKQQARRLVQVIIIVSKPVTGPVVKERAMLSVVSQNPREAGSPASRSYIAVTKIKDDPELREQIRSDALRELGLWVNKYRNFGFDEFGAVFEFYDEHCV